VILKVVVVKDFSTDLLEDIWSNACEPSNVTETKRLLLGCFFLKGERKKKCCFFYQNKQNYPTKV